MKKKLIEIPTTLSNQVQAYADKHHGGVWRQACREILEEKMLEEKQKVFQNWAEGVCDTE